MPVFKDLGFKEYSYIEEVMEYFGKWLGDKETARKIMIEAGIYSDSGTLTSALRAIRFLLSEKYGIKDIPFITNSTLSEKANERRREWKRLQSKTE